MERRKIYIVDDSTLWRTALKDAFSEKGYRVETGNDGLSAVKAIRNAPPDVVLTDFFLPRVDGGRICDFVKSHPELSHIPIVILSGGLHGNIARDRYANANAVVAKGPLNDTVALCCQVVSDMFDEEARGRYDSQIASVIQLTPREITNKLIKLHDYLDVLHRDLVDAIFEVDEHRTIARVNPAGLSLLGVDESSVLGVDFLEAVSIDKASALAVSVGAAAGGRPFDTGPFEHKLGERCFQSTVSRIHPRSDATGAIVLSRDVTEVKEAEREKTRLREQLERAQKLESLGRLAGGVAHDINNVLAGIMGLASVIDEDLDAAHPLRQDVEDIIKACEKGSDLTRNLLGFARRGKIKRQRVMLSDTLRDVTHLLSRTFPKKIVVETAVDEDLPLVEGDPSQLQHAIMNVCINGADALEGEGTLSVEVVSERLSEDELQLFGGVRPGTYVCVRVRDDGVGMDAETLKRCMEPFFTTKGPDRGTGLGLSMVYGTIANHGGYVTVDSTVGEGTTVSLHVPIADDGESDRVAGEASGQFVLATGKILLVDDEPNIRSAGKRQLERLGYQVDLASDGREALERFKAEKDDYCLVILDLVMPVMDGAETFYQLRKIDPEVRVLLASGFSVEGQAEKLLNDGARGFIQKPFGLDLLLTAMAEALS